MKPAFFSRLGTAGVLLAAIAGSLACAPSFKSTILVFSLTKGFHHASIPNGIAAIQKLGAENGFTVDTTTDASTFKQDILKKYAAVVFLNTTGDILNDEQQAAFQHYIRSGGGFVGVHSSTDTEYEWA